MIKRINLNNINVYTLIVNVISLQINNNARLKSLRNDKVILSILLRH